MSVTRVATSGHRNVTVETTAKRFILAMDKKYGRELVIVNGGAEGWDQSVLKACLWLGVKYELHLPFESSKKKLSDRMLRGACYIKVYRAVWEGPQSYAVYGERDRAMVDVSGELHVYWDSRRSGGTYDTMKYAKRNNKLKSNWCI